MSDATNALGGIITAIKSQDVKKRKPDPYTYAGYTLDQLIAKVPERIEAAVTEPTARSSKDLCRLSREMFDKFYNRISFEGSGSFCDSFVAALHLLRDQAEHIAQKLDGNERTQAQTSLDTISGRISDAELLLKEGFGRFGEVIEGRILHFAEEKPARAAI
jgi:hypothetical protein